MNMRIIITILSIVILLILLGIVIYFANPLLGSEGKIREKLLEYTPIGTKMNDVVSFIESREDWEIENTSYEHGFLHQGTQPPERIGEQSIRIYLGDYRIVFITSVTVFYGFDENSELIDIWVWKDTDVI
jgi:NADH:ubiquinone oxidoreductase subunit 3 (subunit A)